MKKVFLLLLIIPMLVACHPQRYEVSRVPRIPWPEAEYSKLEKKGDSSLSGQAFMRTRGGDVKVAAGSKVTLNPVTSYSTQFYDIVIRGTNGLSDLEPKSPDGRIYDYVREKIADAEGRFTFKDIPEGEYYLYTVVSWEVPTGAGLKKQGGWLYQRVNIKNGDNEIILTK